MISAFVTSTLFLTSYLIYHFSKELGPTRFQGEGIIRPVYFFILITHGSGHRDRANGLRDVFPRAEEEIRPSPKNRALDPADLALCFGDRRDRLPDALSALATETRRHREGDRRQETKAKKLPFCLLVSSLCRLVSLCLCRRKTILVTMIGVSRRA